jgi:hypothetical protein
MVGVWRPSHTHRYRSITSVLPHAFWLVLHVLLLAVLYTHGVSGESAHGHLTDHPLSTTELTAIAGGDGHDDGDGDGRAAHIDADAATHADAARDGWRAGPAECDHHEGTHSDGGCVSDQPQHGADLPDRYLTFTPRALRSDGLVLDSRPRNGPPPRPHSSGHASVVLRI